MKTFFEELSDTCERGMEIEQSLRLAAKMKSNWQDIVTISPLAQHKIAVLTRYEKMLRGYLKRFKNEVINDLNLKE